VTLVQRLRNNHGLAYLLLTVCMLFLAANHVIGRWVHADVPPVGLSFWRWTVAAFMLLPFVAPRLRATVASCRADIGNLALLGGLIVGSTTVILIALNFTTAINVSLINATQPTITVLFSWLFFRQRLSPRQAAGIALAFCGVAVMLMRGRLDVMLSLGINGGDLVALAAMTGFSAYAVNIRRLPAGLNPVEALFGIVVAGSLLLLPFYALESMLYRPMPLTPAAVAAVLALALLVSCLAMLLWNLGNQAVGPNRASVFMNLIPVFGATLAIALLDESLAWFHLAGAALVAAGIALVVGRLSRT
jgi:drug/metabolite transporter (DMT)-like permease